MFLVNFFELHIFLIEQVIIYFYLGWGLPLRNWYTNAASFVSTKLVFYIVFFLVKRNNIHSRQSAFNFETRSALNSTQTNLKKTNYLVYRFIRFYYNVFVYVLLHPLQRRFINLYTVLLNTNRLPFRILPPVFKNILLISALPETWLLIFKRLYNNRNIYILRQRFFKKIHNFWSIYYTESNRYYYELNSKRKGDSEISNYYYKARVSIKNYKIPYGIILRKKLRYKPIFYYFFNKICFNKYPYLYWTYVLPYNKYETVESSLNASDNNINTSQHIRTFFFFIFVNLIKTKKLKIFKKSFFKYSCNKINGYKNLFKMFTVRLKAVYKKKIIKDKIFNKFESKVQVQYIINVKNSQKHLKGFLENNKIGPFTNLLQRAVSTIYTNKYITPVILKAIQKLTSGLVITWYTNIYNHFSMAKKPLVSFYLRSAKQFNKGRYSRNRQLYRTGVYWCIWLNIVLVYGFYFYFYRFVFSFGYFWYPIGILLLSIFLSRIYKYRLYSLNPIVTELNSFANFIYVNILKARLFYLNIFKQQVDKQIDFYLNYFYVFWIYFVSRCGRAKAFFLRVFSSTNKS